MHTRPFMARLQQVTEQAIVENTPVETSLLRNSWEGSSDADYFVVGNTQDYGKYPEWGTDGPITPHNEDGQIVFYSNKYGRTFYLKEVSGQAAQYFVFNALKGLFPTAKIIRN